jgi:hypothetical protein
MLTNLFADHNHLSKAATESQEEEKVPTQSADTNGESKKSSNNNRTAKVANGAVASQSVSAQHTPRRPNVLSRGSEKTSTTSSPSPKSNGDSGPSHTQQRRGSWISNLSSKFSSTATQGPLSPAPTPPKPVPEKAPVQSTTKVLPPAAPHGTDKDDLSPYVPSPPATKNPGFLQNAFRRLSSTSTPMGKAAGSHGGICQRKVMNVDQNRERCRIGELDQSKLRRVAFCVDVEIAGGPKYVGEDENMASKKTKDTSKKMKEKGEGEALKNPETVTAQKENEGVVKSGGEEVETVEALPAAEKPAEETAEKADSKKREKKRRTEEERKERKEKKRRQAEANGEKPIEMVRSSPDETPSNSPPGASSPPKPQDRPTVDPLRIYRRCCQLRETPPIKKVIEQLASPAVCPASTPGVVSILDLSGMPIHITDIITLGDFFAVVPVKKVMVENCSLGDEAVRVILAGLLSARAHDSARSSPPSLTATANGRSQRSTSELYGVVEKLSLKNNEGLTKEGWKHICLFLHMSHSLKAIDLSGIPFPPSTTTISTSPKSVKSPVDLTTLFAQSIAERLAGPHLEEIVMAECQLKADQIDSFINAFIELGLTRLGLANNQIDLQGIRHIARFLKNGKCEGLDLGGNDLRKLQRVLAGALSKDNPLYALSLADCNLDTPALSVLFPALISLPNFRFVDLSHNRALFSEKPTALNVLREYLPQLLILKRIHLTDVAMTPDDAIALAEVLPEVPSLAHLNILENPLVSALANARNEASQEEACALYASVMIAVRVSQSIIAVDIDVPSPESSEVVKALAKQIVAYCLHNMESGAVAEVENKGESVPTKGIEVPNVLLHLVGQVEGFPENHDEDPPAPDDDYVIGGTGVVKALGVCLRRQGKEGNDSGGTATPKAALPETEYGRGKAKDMSKDLLGSARKIRSRLQPALIKEAKSEDSMNYREFCSSLLKLCLSLLGRLLFLDQTLKGVIKRFEDEYPETRLPEPVYAPPGAVFPPAPIQIEREDPTSDPAGPSATTIFADDEEISETEIKPPLSRHDSDVSLASRALSNQEGRMHRFGQSLRREILPPQGEDHAHGTTGEEIEAEHLQALRNQLEALGGEEILDRVEGLGHKEALREIERAHQGLMSEPKTKDTDIKPTMTEV